MLSASPGLRCLLDALLDVLDSRCRPRGRLIWTITVGTTGVQCTSGDTPMLMLPVDKTAQLSIIVQDVAGNPAQVDGAPVWTVSDATFGSLAVADDGFSAVYTPAGTLGTVQVNVSCDADLGDGIKAINGALDIQIEAGEAAVIAINATVV